MERRCPEFGHKIDGPVVLAPTPHRDERGSFSRLSCPEEFSAFGLDFTPVQMSLSRNHAIHTLRGMHDQADDWAEGKIVRAVRGAIYDVAVDLRPNSPTYCQWCATILSAETMHAFYIPRGFSHGFLTLEADSDVLYQIDRMFVPGHGRGFRWNDPAFGIDWPHEPQVIGERDATYADFKADGL
ncbi:MAG: dTDP-4-dehydrorhamnose 3,5-epimerase family protein [Cohaesibacter sp.]|nr:dTDP-4-dehydrorhamnose 3,5-epimerase family protein [Cohaesibacter sp.]